MGGSKRFCAPFPTRPAWIPALLLIALASVASVAPAVAKDRRAEVTYSVNLNAPAKAKNVRLWLPYLMSDENQEITDVVVSGNPTSTGVYREGAFGNSALYAEWKNSKGPRTLTYSFKVLRRERVTNEIPAQELPFSKTEFRKELAPTRLAKLQGPEKDLAEKITAGKGGDMTKAQHCWAEWYSPGYGWVVVDPADVRKAILERKITLEQAKPLREYYFGAVDESRIAIGTGRDLVLNPPQSGEPLNYFMYPYAEADGKPLNEDLFGFNLGYRITFREL